MDKKKVTKKVQPKPEQKFPFNTDQTTRGDRILALFGPDESGDYAGVLAYEDGLVGKTWDSAGTDIDGENDLVRTDAKTKTFKRIK